jgi:hypothetical protein
LVEAFYSRHFEAFFAGFEAIGDEHRAALDAYQGFVKEAEDHGSPEGNEFTQVQARGVKEIEQAMITLFFEPMTANKARDSSRVVANGHRGRDDD